jgi:PAS domain S-box-containing protein
MNSTQSSSLVNAQLYLVENLHLGYGHLQTVFDENRLSDFIFLHVNPAFRTILSLGDVAGKKFSEIFPDLTGAPKEFVDLMRSTAISGERASMELNIELLGKWFDLTVLRPVVGELIVFFSDITKRKQTEQEFMRINDKFNTAMETGKIGWWEMDIASGNVDFAPIKAEMLGYSPEDFKHYQDFTNLIHPDDYEQAMEAMRAHLYGKKDRYETEYRIRAKNGDYVWYYDIGGVNAFHQTGGMKSITGFVINDTERMEAVLALRKSEQLLKEVNSQKDKLFSIIAHDLRGPFGTFMAMLEMTTKDFHSFSHDDIQNIIHSMRYSGDKLYRLLDELLQWANVQRGVMPFQPEKLVLADILHEAAETFRQTAALKGISLIVEAAGKISVRADKQMTIAVVRNLISNAVKFTPREGIIRIDAADADGGKMNVSISDNGIGMPPAVLAGLFRIDENVGRPGTENEPSSGLGLMLCKEFVEKNGGTIWAGSTEGQGSTFSFSLPKGEL